MISAASDDLLHCDELYISVQYTIQYSQFSILHYCTILHCTALHYTALHYSALHCTALHCTAECILPSRDTATWSNGEKWLLPRTSSSLCSVVYSVQCTVYITFQFTVYSTLYEKWQLPRTSSVYSVQCSVECTVYITLCSVQWTVHSKRSDYGPAHHHHRAV